MDIGREFFHNIEELAVFALAAGGRIWAGLPEVGGGHRRQGPREIGGPVEPVADAGDAVRRAARRSRRPTSRSKARPAAATSLTAFRRSSWCVRRIAAWSSARTGRWRRRCGQSANKESIEKDPAFAGLLAQITPDTSKAVLVDVGRALQVAAAMSRRNDARESDAPPPQLAGDMKVSLVTDEAPNQLVIRAEVSGLPKFRDIMSFILRNDSRGRTATDSVVEVGQALA